MIKFHQEFHSVRTGLGYQTSIYLMMRSIEERTGFKWETDDNSLTALRNTFSGLNLNSTTHEIDISTFLVPFVESTVEFYEFEIAAARPTVTNFNERIYDGFDNIVERIKDNSKIFAYPSPVNFISIKEDGEELFLRVKNELKFRQDIFNKCKTFKESFGSEVIALHIRSGDYHKLENATFMCGNDYYENALFQLPSDTPVLVFTNDKDAVISNNQLVFDNPDRFIFISDLFNNNEVIDCVIGNELDRLVDMNGNCNYNYKDALINLAKNKLDSDATNLQIKEEVSRLVNQLNPLYRDKIRTHSYNYSYDLCMMSMCDYFIMSNSTYSLLASQLGSHKKVIYPMYWIQDLDKDNFIKKDLGDYDQTKEMCSGILDRPNFFGIKNPDPRSFAVISEISNLEPNEDGYFYKSLDVMPEELLNELYESSVYWLERTRKPVTREVYPPEATDEILLDADFINSDIWQKFYSEMRKHISRYCSISDMHYPSIRIHSSWITRVADIEIPGQSTRDEMRFRLKNHVSIGGLHSHTQSTSGIEETDSNTINPIGLVYYLKNPDPEYGTIVKLSEDKIFYNSGEENSLVIFDPRLHHAAIYPPVEVIEKYPRISIVIDCCYR
jgi:hypothetical protein